MATFYNLSFDDLWVSHFTRYLKYKINQKAFKQTSNVFLKR